MFVSLDGARTNCLTSVLKHTDFEENMEIYAGQIAIDSEGFPIEKRVILRLDEDDVKEFLRQLEEEKEKQADIKQD